MCVILFCVEGTCTHDRYRSITIIFSRSFTCDFFQSRSKAVVLRRHCHLPRRRRTTARPHYAYLSDRNVDPLQILAIKYHVAFTPSGKLHDISTQALRCWKCYCLLGRDNYYGFPFDLHPRQREQNIIRLFRLISSLCSTKILRVKGKMYVHTRSETTFRN